MTRELRDGQRGHGVMEAGRLAHPLSLPLFFWITCNHVVISCTFCYLPCFSPLDAQRRSLLLGVLSTHPVHQPRVTAIAQQLFQSPPGRECGALTQMGLTQMLFACRRIKATPNSSGCERWKRKGSELKKQTTSCDTTLRLSKERVTSLRGNGLTPFCIFLYTGSTWSQRC